MDLDEIWTETLLILRRQTTQATYDTILANTRLLDMKNGGFSIGTHSEEAKDWLENRLLITVSRALGDYLDREIPADQITVVVNGSDQAAEGEEDRPFYVRNRRKTRRYYVDNEFLDLGYGAHVGPIGIAVYNVLCFRADANSQQCYPGKGYIAKLIGVADSRPVRAAVARLESLNLIHRTPRYEEKTKTHSSDLYDLLDISEWKTLPDIKE